MPLHFRILETNIVPIQDGKWKQYKSQTTGIQNCTHFWNILFNAPHLTQKKNEGSGFGWQLENYYIKIYFSDFLFVFPYSTFLVLHMGIN
jgi:hypothetical protein